MLALKSMVEMTAFCFVEVVCSCLSSIMELYVGISEKRESKGKGGQEQNAVYGIT